MRHLKTLLTVLGAVTVLVLAGNTVALATTGHAFILGKSNSAKTITSLTRTKSGPALKVATKRSSNPPFVVNGHGKVTNLNADTVDGLQGAALQNRVIQYRLTPAAGSSIYDWHLPGLPAGTYLATYTVYGSGAGSGQCWFQKSSDTSRYKVLSAGVVYGSTIAWNGSGIVKSTDFTSFRCQGSSTFSVDASTGGPTEITFTRIDAVTGHYGIT